MWSETLREQHHMEGYERALENKVVEWDEIIGGEQMGRW